MINYISAGHFISEEKWIHPKRYINSYEIIFVLKGNVYIAEDGNNYTLSENQILLLEPELLHFGTEKSIGTEFYWVHFTNDIKPDFKCFTPGGSYEIKSQIKRLIHIANTPNYPVSSLNAAVTLLLNEIEYQFSHCRLTPENELSGRICEYIRINADLPLSVEKIAEHFGYTSGYISKFFKSKYNLGLKQFIETERLKYAKSLLITTSDSIKQIAYKMNYSDEKNFIKFFSYHEKISPTKYRNIYFHTHQNNK